jgi:hypothetical protein
LEHDPANEIGSNVYKQGVEKRKNTLAIQGDNLVWFLESKGLAGTSNDFSAYQCRTKLTTKNP